MDIVTAGRSCLRRWYLFIPILAIGIFASYHVAKATKPTYTAVAEFVILGSSEQPVKAAPTQTKVQGGGGGGKNKASTAPTPTPTPKPQPTTTARNPYTGSSSDLRGTLLAQMNDIAFQKQFADQGLKGSYAIGGKKKSSLIDITAAARRPKTAVDLANAVLARTNGQIHQIQTQAGAPADQLVNTRPVLSATNAVEATKGKSKRLVSGIVITVAAAIALSIALDSAMLALRRRRGSRVAVEADAGPQAAQDAPPAAEPRVAEPATTPTTTTGGRRRAGRTTEPAPAPTRAAADEGAARDSWLSDLTDDPAASSPAEPEATADAPDAGPITRLSRRRTRT